MLSLGSCSVKPRRAGWTTSVPRGGWGRLPPWVVLRARDHHFPTLFQGTTNTGKIVWSRLAGGAEAIAQLSPLVSDIWRMALGGESLAQSSAASHSPLMKACCQAWIEQDSQPSEQASINLFLLIWGDKRTNDLAHVMYMDCGKTSRGSATTWFLPKQGPPSPFIFPTPQMMHTGPVCAACCIIAQFACKQQQAAGRWTSTAEGVGRWHEKQQSLSFLLENVYLNGQIY